MTAPREPRFVWYQTPGTVGLTVKISEEDCASGVTHLRITVHRQEAGAFIQILRHPEGRAFTYQLGGDVVGTGAVGHDPSSVEVRLPAASGSSPSSGPVITHNDLSASIVRAGVFLVLRKPVDDKGAGVAWVHLLHPPRLSKSLAEVDWSRWQSDDPEDSKEDAPLGGYAWPGDVDEDEDDDDDTGESHGWAGRDGPALYESMLQDAMRAQENGGFLPDDEDDEEGGDEDGDEGGDEDGDEGGGEDGAGESAVGTTDERDSAQNLCVQ